MTAFAKRSGLDQSLLSKYVRGESLPRVDRAAEIAAAAGVSLDWLLGGEPRGSSGDGAATAAPAERSFVPVVSRIRAGLMSLYEVEHHTTETIPVSTSLARAGEALFGLRIEGDSMSPFMLPADVAICSTVRSYEVGDDVAFYRQASGESTVKRLDALDPKTRRARLRPLNPEYAPLTVEIEPGDQLAVVVAVFRETTRRRRRPSFQ